MHKILYLGPNSPVVAFLRDMGEDITIREDRLVLDDCRGYDWLISYGYRYILGADIVNFMKGRAINLHIAYLPWNRGADPNYWSWKDDTPKGVTIHEIDEGVDTGRIIAQRKVCFCENCVIYPTTLKLSYEKLQREIQQLFKDAWQGIKIGHKDGSYHKVGDMPKLEKGWDTKVNEL